MIITPMTISPLANNMLTEFNPSDLQGIVWQYEDEFIVTVAPDIDQWTDLSGNDNHATQGVALDKPHIVVDDIDNKDAALFDGIRKYFDTGDPYQAEFRDDFMITMAIKIADGQPASAGAFVGSRDAADRIIVRLNNTGARRFVYNDGTNVAEFITNDVLSNGAQPYVIYTFWADFSGDALLKIRQNGVNLASNGVETGDTSLIVPANFTTTRNLYLGARNFNGVADRFASMNGASALFVAKPQISMRDVDEVEKYLSNKYGIALV